MHWTSYVFWFVNKPEIEVCMSRQLEQKSEQKTTAKRELLVKVLDYGLVGALEATGIELIGFSFTYDAWACLMTIRADRGGRRDVCHVGSDTVINTFIKAYHDARGDRLVWKACKYHKSEV